MKTLIILSALTIGLTITKSSIADNAPKDFRVIMRDGGGMSRQGAEYFISKDSSYADIWEDDAETKIYFKVSTADLNKLYNIITNNEFEDVETFREEVYDRGGTTISVRANGEEYEKVDAGMTFIVESWRDEFANVENEIRRIVGDKLETMKREVTITIDENIMEADKIVNFNIGDFTYMSARDGWQKIVTVKLYPGQHYMYFTMLNKELTTEPGTKIFAQGDGIINIDKDTKSLYIYREGENILWK
jgi:hypothetical protein